jgi:hypothetical protein
LFLDFSENHFEMSIISAKVYFACISFNIIIRSAAWPLPN